MTSHGYLSESFKNKQGASREIIQTQDAEKDKIILPHRGKIYFQAINDIKAGKIEYRLDKTNIIHCPIGKASFEQTKLQENFKVLLEAVVKARPSAAKGQYIKSVAFALTMGPGIKILHQSLL